MHDRALVSETAQREREREYGWDHRQRIHALLAACTASTHCCSEMRAAERLSASASSSRATRGGLRSHVAVASASSCAKCHVMVLASRLPRTSGASFLYSERLV